MIWRLPNTFSKDVKMGIAIISGKEFGVCRSVWKRVAASARGQ